MKWSEVQEKHNQKKNVETVRAVFILDESSSMAGQQSSVISGFNECIADLKTDPNPIDYLITLIKFSDEAKTVFRDLPLNQVENLNTLTYKPNGMTALLDAVGTAIYHYGANQKNVMLTIFTDGQENVSKRFNNSGIKELLTSRQDANRWGVIFMGADVAAWGGGMAIGSYASNTVNFNNDYSMAYSNTTRGIRNYASNVYCSSMTGELLKNDNLMDQDQVSVNVNVTPTTTTGTTSSPGTATTASPGVVTSTTTSSVDVRGSLPPVSPIFGEGWRDDGTVKIKMSNETVQGSFGKLYDPKTGKFVDSLEHKIATILDKNKKS